MPNVLDENVIILKFDNSNFQKNTQESIDSLDRLKSSIDKSNSMDSLKKFGDSANSINLSGLSKAVDTINKRFSIMGIAGMAAINKLTGSAISSAKNIITSIPSQMVQGGWRRALNIEQAEFLMKGLGYTFDGFYKKLEDGTEVIEGVKGAVLASVKSTAFGLDEAAKAAASFMASGVTETNELTKSLRAVSGVAAITSSDYMSVANIFTKVAGSGRMMAGELNQLSEKGFNAAQQISKYLNENKDVAKGALDAAIAAGRQTKAMQAISEQAEISEADVRTMASAGAISFDIMTNALAHFYDTAKTANDTFTGSSANIKASLSRMGAQFEEVKLQNLTKIFNHLLPVMDRLETVIEPFTKKIGEASTKVAGFLSEGIINPIGLAIGLKPEELAHKFGKSAEKAGDQASKATKKVDKDAKAAGKGLKVTAKEWQAALDIWYKGTYGNDKKRADSIRELGMSYENVQGIINRFYEVGFDWSKVEHTIVDENEKNAESTKKVGEAAEETAPKLSTLGRVVQGVMNFFKAAKKIFTGVKDLFVAFGTSAKKIITPTVGLLADHLLASSYNAKGLADRFASFAKSVKESAVGKTFDGIGKALFKFTSNILLAFNTAKRYIGGLFTTLFDFFKKLDASEGFEKLKTSIGDLIDKIQELAGSGLKTVFDYFSKIGDIGAKAGGIDRVVEVFSGIASRVSDLINNIIAGKNPLESFIDIVGKLRDKLDFKKAAKAELGAKLSDAIDFNSIKYTVGEFKKLKIGPNLIDAGENISEFLSKLSKGAKNIDVGSIKNRLKQAMEALSNQDWDKFSKIAMRMVGVFAIFKGVRDMSSVANAAVGMLGSISGFFSSLSGISNAFAKQIKIESFRTIATSIAILIGAIIALAAVPTDRMVPAMKGITVLLGEMIAVIALMNTKAFSPENMKAIGIAFAGMGAGLFMVANATRMFAKMKTGELVKGGVAIAAFMTMFVVAGRMAGDVKSAGLGFLAMAWAVNSLLATVQLFALIKWSILLAGAAKIGILASVLGASMRVAGEAGAKGGLGFLAMAAAVNLLVPPIMLLGIMPFGKALKGAGLVSGIMLALAYAAKIASVEKKSFTALTGMAVVVGVVAAAILVLSFINPAKALESAACISGVVLALGFAAKQAQTSLGGIIAMSVMIGIITAAIIALIKIDADAALKVATTLSAVGVSLGITARLFASMGIGGAISGALAFGAFIGVVGGVIAALGALNKIPGLQKLIGSGGNLLAEIGTAIGKFIGSIGSGMVTGFTSGLPQAATDLGNFMTSLKPFLDGMKSVDPASISNIKNLSTAMVALKGGNALDGLTSMFGGKSKSFSEIGKEMGSFIDEIIPHLQKLGSSDAISDASAEKAGMVVDVINKFSQAAQKMPKEDGLFQKVTGNTQSIGDFVSGLAKVPKKLKTFSENASDFTPADIEKIEPVANALGVMAKAAKKIPPSEGAAQLLMGNTTINEFAEQLALFIPHFKKFADAVNGTDVKNAIGSLDKVDAVADAISAMAKASDKIPETGGLKSAIVGDPNLPLFAEGLANAAPSISDFASAVSTMGDAEIESLDTVDSISKALIAMAKVNESLPETGGWKQKIFGEKGDFAKFADGLSSAMPNITKFVQQVQKAKFDNKTLAQLPKLGDGLKAISDFNNSLPDNMKAKDTSGLTASLSGKDGLVEALASFTAKLKGKNSIDISAIETAKTAITKIKDSATAFNSIPRIANASTLPNMAKAASSYAKTMNKIKTSNLGSAATAVANSVKSLAKAGAAAAGNKSISSGFASAGKNVGKAFADGIKKANSKSAGSSLAKNAKSGASSISLYSGGKNVGQGFVNGINAKRSAAYTAGYNLGKAAKKGQQDATGEQSPAKEFIKGGKFAGEGFVIGMNALSKKVYDSGYNMGRMSVLGADDAISAINDLSNPQITPVVDLTNVEASVSQIDSLFSRNSAMSIDTNMAANLAHTRESNRMMDELVSKLDKMVKPNETDSLINNSRSVNMPVNVQVDGSSDPEAFADQLIRSFRMKMRTV